MATVVSFILGLVGGGSLWNLNYEDKLILFWLPYVNRGNYDILNFKVRYCHLLPVRATLS